MTDNEIIKALECCCSKEIQCRNCPLPQNVKDGLDCGTVIAKECLDLINRQKAEIEALKMDNQQLQSDIVNANMNADHALAEIERLRDGCSSCCVLNAKSETISDLNEQIEYWQRGYNDLRQEIKTANAKAIKEFAERLKEDCPGELLVIHFDAIADLVNEIVGDNNG